MRLILFVILIITCGNKLFSQFELTINDVITHDYLEKSTSCSINRVDNSVIYSFQGNMYYNKELVEIVGLINSNNSIIADRGIFLYTDDSSNSTIKYAWADAQGINQSGNLFDIIFLNKKPGSSAFSTENPQNGQETFIVNNGEPNTISNSGSIICIAPYVNFTDFTLRTDNQFTINMFAKNFIEIGSLSFILKIGENIQFEQLAELNDNLSISHSFKNGNLNLGWVDFTTANSLTIEQAALCELTFSYLELSGRIEFDPISEITDAFGKKLPIKFEDYLISNPTGVLESGRIKEYNLTQNYPNPFNPSTTIRYDLPAASQVKIKVVNLLGETVAELVNDNIAAGQHQVSWNAANVASGIYFYSIEAKSVDGGKDFNVVRKMMLLK